MSDPDLTPCGDASCIMLAGKRAGGMVTNGGCAHLKRYGPDAVRQLRVMAREIVALRERVAELEPDRA